MVIRIVPVRLMIGNAFLSWALALALFIILLRAEGALASLGYAGFMLVLLPVPVLFLADGVVLLSLRRRLRPVFAYYVATRALLLVGLSVLAYMDAAALEGYQFFPAFVLAYALVVGATTFGLYRADHSRRLGLAAAAVVLGALAINGFVLAGSLGWVASSAADRKSDEQISYDFLLLRQDIQTLGAPGGTISEVVAQGEYSRQFKIADRAQNYFYEPMVAEHSFKLCASFKTDTMPKVSVMNNESYHHRGYQCFIYPK